MRRSAIRLGSPIGNTSHPRSVSASKGNMRKGIRRSHIGSGSAAACSKRRAAEHSVPVRQSAGHNILGCNNRRARPCGTSLRRRVVAQARRRAMQRPQLRSPGSQIYSRNYPPRSDVSNRRLAVERGTTLHGLYNTRMPSAHGCLRVLLDARVQAQAVETLPWSGLYWSRSNGL